MPVVSFFFEGNRGFALPSRKSHWPGAMTTTPDHRFCSSALSAISCQGSEWLGEWELVDGEEIDV